MINHDPDNLYYDILVSNIQSNNNPPIIVNYLDTRSIPLLKDTTDYALSIIRFTVSTSVLPVFIPTIQQNQSDINLTIYSFTLSYTDTGTGITYDYQQYLEFAPQDLTTNIPTAPNVNTPYYLQDNSTGYYFVYNYTYLIDLINQTFANALTGLTTVCTTAGVTLPTGIVAPVMTFNLSSLIATINISSTTYGTNESNKVNLYFNQAMAQLFSSFPLQICGLSNGKQFQLCNNFLINTSFTYPSTITQEYSTTSSWNSVESIVFTSTLLPIISSQIALPTLYVNGAVINNNTSNGSLNIITDLVADNFQFKPFLLYVPSGQYRWISLLPNRPIRHIDLQIYFLLKDGSYTPLRLPTGASMSMKLLFSKNFQNW